MLKRFLHKLAQNFAIYILAIMNLVHAIQYKNYDWLLWVSLGLCALSVILSAVSACRGDDNA